MVITTTTRVRRPDQLSSCRVIPDGTATLSSMGTATGTANYANRVISPADYRKGLRKGPFSFFALLPATGVQPSFSLERALCEASELSQTLMFGTVHPRRRFQLTISTIVVDEMPAVFPQRKRPIMALCRSHGCVGSVQNCSQRTRNEGKRIALSNTRERVHMVCNPERQSAARRRSGVSYFAQCLDGHRRGRVHYRRSSGPARVGTEFVQAPASGGVVSVVAVYAAFAGAALPQSQATFSRTGHGVGRVQWCAQPQAAVGALAAHDA